jgi:hypothetical protein
MGCEKFFLCGSDLILVVFWVLILVRLLFWVGFERCLGHFLCCQK